MAAPEASPVPVGRGSIVVRTDRAHSFHVWSAATSLATPTTNKNQAEYGALITGLKAAVRAAWRPLDTVGILGIAANYLLDVMQYTSFIHSEEGMECDHDQATPLHHNQAEPHGLLAGLRAASGPPLVKPRGGWR
jgi:hypothetical protein